LKKKKQNDEYKSINAMLELLMKSENAIHELEKIRLNPKLK